METVRVRGVRLDMDGVLISSTASDERSWRRWARLHGMENSFQLEATHGRRTIDTVRELRPDLDAEVELARLEDFDAEDQDGIVVLRGVRQLLEALPGGAWTVVTSASRRLMRGRLLTAGLRVPEQVVTGDDVSRGKPDPEPYARGAAVLGLRPEECLVIEDAPAGVRAGKAAGCRVLGVSFSHAAEALMEADWVVDALERVSVRVEGGELLLEFDQQPG